MSPGEARLLAKGTAVTCGGPGSWSMPPGKVLRVARDGSWIDVRWCDPSKSLKPSEWSKRMPSSSLEVVGVVAPESEPQGEESGT